MYLLPTAWRRQILVAAAVAANIGIVGNSHAGWPFSRSSTRKTQGSPAATAARPVAGPRPYAATAPNSGILQAQYTQSCPPQLIYPPAQQCPPSYCPPIETYPSPHQPTPETTPTDPMTPSTENQGPMQNQPTPNLNTQPQQNFQPQTPAPSNSTAQTASSQVGNQSVAFDMIGDFFGGTSTFQVRSPGIGVQLNNRFEQGLFVSQADNTAGGDMVLIRNSINPLFGVAPDLTGLELHSVRSYADLQSTWNDLPGSFNTRFELQRVTDPAQLAILRGSLTGLSPEETAALSRPGYLVNTGGVGELQVDDGTVLSGATVVTPGSAANTIVDDGEGGPGSSVNGGVDAETTGIPGEVRILEDALQASLDFVYVPIETLDVPVGALAGRVKLAENSSPIPRDRIMMNYSYFRDVALNAGGVNVNRFTPGFEKTFLDQLMSVEIRAPFAATLDADIGDYGPGAPGAPIGLTNTSAIEFGNLTTTVKLNLYDNDYMTLAGGLGLALPTADDTRVVNANGVQFLRFNNEAIHLMPYLGGVYAPNDRLFFQQIVQVDIPTRGNGTYANLNPNDLPIDDAAGNRIPANLQQVGSLKDPVFLYVDSSVGYWLYHAEAGSGKKVTGVATLFEAHYNSGMSGFDSVNVPLVGSLVPLTIGGGDRFSQVNLVAGGNIEVMDNGNLQIGYVVPVTERETFDGELRVNFGWRFGGSTKAAQSRTRQTQGL